jgi:uncharacterized protein (TIGR03086 family)
MTTTDPSATELILDALADFGSRVRAVPADRWKAPTPCREWTVRDLVNHLVGEHLWAAHLLRGESLDEVGDRYDGDLVGADPVAAWAAAEASSRAAWQGLVSPDQPVTVSAGQTSAEAYAEEMLLDLVVHGWDLARGAGQDETMDPRARDHLLAFVSANVDSWKDAGIFAPPVQTTSADPQDRLLALLGRDPAGPNVTDPSHDR